MKKSITLSQEQLTTIYTALRIERQRAKDEHREEDYILLDDAVTLIHAQL